MARTRQFDTAAVRGKRLPVVALVAILILAAIPAFGTPYTMKGPPSASVAIAAEHPPESPAGVLLLGAIRFYRRFISPTQGPRCGFYPSCSTFGLHAILNHGPVTGGLMTADRLMRCNAFKEPGPDYLLRPDGKLYDPVDANLLKEP